MTTYAVTPTLFVGVDSPDGVAPVFNLSDMVSGDEIVTLASSYLQMTNWEGGHDRPAVVVPNEAIARLVLLKIGLTPEQADDRIDFATRSFRAA